MMTLMTGGINDGMTTLRDYSRVFKTLAEREAERDYLMMKVDPDPDLPEGQRQIAYHTNRLHPNVLFRQHEELKEMVERIPDPQIEAKLYLDLAYASYLSDVFYDGRDQDQLQNAEKFYRHALEIFAGDLGRAHCHLGLLEVYLRQNRSGDAREVQKAAMALYESLNAGDFLDYARSVLP